MKCVVCDGKRVKYGFGGMKNACNACNATGLTVPINVTAHTTAQATDAKVDKRTKVYKDSKEG